MKIIYLTISILFIFIILGQDVLAVSQRGNITIVFSINNWSSGNSDLQSNQWIITDGELYRTYGGSTDTWGLSNLKGRNFTNSTFQVAMFSTAIAGGGIINADHIQVKIYYTFPVNVTLVSPTPSNNSIIGSTLRVNATINVAPTTCKLQNNRNGTLVNETMTIVGSTCNIQLIGLNNNTFLYSVVATSSGGVVGVSQTRNVSIRNLPSLIDLNSPGNNTITTNRSVILNWTINNTQNDEVIVRGFISQNTTANITKQIFYYREGNLNKSYTYNFSNPLTPLNSPGLWALYRFENDSDLNENLNRVYDYSGNNRNGTFNTIQNLTQGKFGRGMFHLANSTADDVILNSSDFANISVNGMSINAWINFSKENLAGIVSRWDSIQNNRFFVFLSDITNKIQFIIYENGNSTFSCSAIGTTILPNNTWIMVTGIFNGSETRVYLNGILEGNTTCSFNGINQTAWQDIEDVTIGKQAGSGINNRGLNGSIDELGFWNRSLSAQEVSDLYNLKNDTYYWYLESNEYNKTNAVNSSMWQFTIGQANTCTYTSGNWNILCSDNCVISSNVIINTNSNVSLTGSGTFNLYANLSGWNQIYKGNECTLFKNNGMEIRR